MQAQNRGLVNQVFMIKKNSTSKFYFSLIFGDLFFLTLLCLYILFFKYKGIGLSIEAFMYIIASYFKEFLIIIFSWFLISGYTKIYITIIPPGTLTFLKKIILHFCIFVLLVLSITNGENSILDKTYSNIFIFLILLIYLVSSRIAFSKIQYFIAQKGTNLRRAIIIGTNDNTDELINNITHNRAYNLYISEIFSSNLDYKFNNIKTNSLQELRNFISQNDFEYAFISLGNELSEVTINKIAESLENKYIEFGFVPNSILENKQSLSLSYLDTFPILTYKKYPLDNSFNQIFKRIFDLIFTFFVFAFILSWAYPILTLLVLIYQGRPIHFSQKRNGLNGEEFNCLKFRTMRDDKNNSLKPTERNDPRVTKLGRILRKTSLDELPQFINVLKGEMSIVGPRPHMVSENESYSDVIKRYSLRHYVKPGITGLAQVKGYRGAVDTDKDMEMRIRTDIYYVRNWSFLLDLFIIYKTAKLMIFGDENAI